MYDSGEEFLNELYKDLHISDIVMHTADKSDSPTTKINKYLARLDRIVNKAHLKEHDWNLFKSLCHSKYVIKEEDIKEDYIAKKISSTTSRDKVIYNTITASKDSLDTWIDFLGSLEDEEMWVKLWIFKGITSMGNYNDDRKAFSRRTKHTTSPFPMFDPVITLDVIDKVKTLIKTNDQELIDDAITSESFARLYAYYFDCQEDEVAITKEGIKDNTICYYGDISETNEELNISLPKYVVGDVRCPNLVSTKGLERLEVVTNDLSLPKIDSKLASLKEVWGYDTAGILDKKQDKKM